MLNRTLEHSFLAGKVERLELEVNYMAIALLVLLGFATVCLIAALLARQSNTLKPMKDPPVHPSTQLARMVKFVLCALAVAGAWFLAEGLTNCHVVSPANAIAAFSILASAAFVAAAFALFQPLKK